MGFVEQLYQAHEDFRAETEALRWLSEHSRDPAQASVELLRAKLYYRERRFAESDLMLYSLVDRFPLDPAAQDAKRLLGYSQIRQGRIEDGGKLLAATDPAAPPIAPLQAPAPAALDKARALAWSTWLPGTGFFVLGEPAKAASALSLNLLAITGAVLTYRQGNAPAALLFALVEVYLYQGGRDSVQEEADALAQRDLHTRTERWLTEAGEPALLQVGMRWRF